MMWKALFFMTAVSFAARFLPFLFSKFFTRLKIFDRLSTALPTTLLILLTFYQLKPVVWNEFPHGMPEIGGLLAVIGCQYLFRQTILSMGVGVLAHQLLRNFL